MSSSLLVFVCAYNACRSAIAQVIASDEAFRRSMPLEVASAGTHALPGYAAASIAQTTISEIGLSLEHHRSQPASADLIARATLVVAMTDTQRDMLQTAFPNDKDKIVSFNDVTGLGDVLDPVGGDAAQVRAVRDLLQRGMPAVFETFEKYVHTSR